MRTLRTEIPIVLSRFPCRICNNLVSNYSFLEKGDNARLNFVVGDTR